jgi:protein gp37
MSKRELATVDRTEIDLASVSLDELAKLINLGHKVAYRWYDNGNRMIGDSRRMQPYVGQMLIEAKGRLKHGQWAGWVQENCVFGIREAENYMRVRREAGPLDPLNPQRVADLSLRKMVKALSKPRERPQPSNGEATATEEEVVIDVEATAVSEGTEPAPIVMDSPKSRPTFNQTNEMVSWAKWTWNPVTGCEHTCVYCYARDIANMRFPEKFAPTYHPNRLGAPRNTKVPDVSLIADPIEKVGWKNVFVCSMADLFGRWVPREWIDAVFDSCARNPQWNYLFLTKFPQRYVDLDFPPTSWVGTTVDEQKRVANAEKAFKKIKVPVKWLSVEPMREPLQFTDLSMFDWVVIGGQSRSSGAPEFFPPFDWVNNLIYLAHKSGCKVYCKPNTDPDGHWAGLLQEYPDIFTRQGEAVA